MAEEAYRNDLTSKLTFSVTVWALLLATLLSPFAFRNSLSPHHQRGSCPPVDRGIDKIVTQGKQDQSRKERNSEQGETQSSHVLKVTVTGTDNDFSALAREELWGDEEEEVELQDIRGSF